MAAENPRSFTEIRDLHRNNKFLSIFEIENVYTKQEWWHNLLADNRVNHRFRNIGIITGINWEGSPRPINDKILQEDAEELQAILRLEEPPLKDLEVNGDFWVPSKQTQLDIALAQHYGNQLEGMYQHQEFREIIEGLHTSAFWTARHYHASWTQAIHAARFAAFNFANHENPFLYVMDLYQNRFGIRLDSKDR